MLKLSYNFLFFLFSIFYLPMFILKGKGRGGFGSRLGKVPDEIVQKLKGKKVLWVHAVSVGEVALALRLLKHWQSLFPKICFVLTTTTVAGYEVASKTKSEEVTLLHFPVDFGFSVRRFIRSIGPGAVVMMETEVWPNLVWELQSKKIPLLILNGRISDRAIGSYRRVRCFLKSIFGALTAVGAQEEEMRQRFIELGAEPSRVVTTGNLKFDWEPSAGASPELVQLRQKLIRSGDFLLVAASTHAGEEEIFFDLYKELKPGLPRLQLLMAPRHLDRLSSIETAASARSLRLKRVFIDAANGYDDSSDGVWILDRMGVLAHFYPVADAVFVGGSLVPVGGHNLVEPAYFGKPVLFGCHTQNFQEMSELFLKKGAAFRLEGAKELKEKLILLYQNQATGRQMGEAAHRLLSSCRGALKANTDLLVQATGEFLK